MQILFCVMMFILGACIGSFLCCQARRLNLRTEKHKTLGSRSVCLSCKKPLKWYENIPLFSWLVQRGKCKKCGTKIGIAEFLSELGVGLASLVFSINFNIFFATPLEWGIFAATLLLIFTLSFLAIYDGLYGKLPTMCLFVAIICAFVVLALKSWETSLISLNPLYAALILGGLYLVLYLVSNGKWVGDGDWLLGLAIGIALGSPWLALIVLFLSNTLACIVMLPSAKRTKNHKIHFGPFLVVAYIVVASFSGLLESMVL